MTALRDRLIFVGLTCGLTLLGVLLYGDLRLSWWVALLPLLLLTGPAIRFWRSGRAQETSGGSSYTEH